MDPKKKEEVYSEWIDLDSHDPSMNITTYKGEYKGQYGIRKILFGFSPSF